MAFSVIDVRENKKHVIVLPISQDSKIEFLMYKKNKKIAKYIITRIVLFKRDRTIITRAVVFYINNNNNNHRECEFCRIALPRRVYVRAYRGRAKAEGITKKKKKVERKFFSPLYKYIIIHAVSPLFASLCACSRRARE